MPNMYYVKTSKLARWLAEHSGGLIKSESQANLILMVLALILIAVAGVIFYLNLFPTGGANVPPPELPV